MTHWFGSFIDLEPDHGYFYLCPACYADRVAAQLEEVQEKLARLHPSTAALWDRETEAGPGAAQEAEEGGTAAEEGGASEEGGGSEEGGRS